MQNKNIKRVDKYKAIWLSHSSISDYKKCQRLYYLQNIYKNPKTGKKINLSSPYKTLGVSVHSVLENLNKLKIEDRLKVDFLSRFEEEWNKNVLVAGFNNKEEEGMFKDRGIKMLQNVKEDYKILKNKTIPLNTYYDGDMLPNIYVDEYENVILCGNLDWIEYNQEDKTLSVVDFKTGKNEEKEDSYQLPIYKILLESLQDKWKVKNGKYWYLEPGDIVEKSISEDTVSKILEDVKKIGIEIRDKRFSWDEKFSAWQPLYEVEERFLCTGGEKCECKKYDKVLNGEGMYLGEDIYGKEIYKI